MVLTISFHLKDLEVLIKMLEQTSDEVIKWSKCNPVLVNPGMFPTMFVDRGNISYNPQVLHIYNNYTK